MTEGTIKDKFIGAKIIEVDDEKRLKSLTIQTNEGKKIEFPHPSHKGYCYLIETIKKEIEKDKNDK